MRSLGFTSAGLGDVRFTLGNPTFIVTGFQLLKQRVIVELLSTQRDGHGTGLPQILEAGYNTTSELVTSQLREAIYLATDHVIANTSKSATTHERLQELTLLNSERSDQFWTIDIQIKSEAGDVDQVSLA